MRVLHLKRLINKLFIISMLLLPLQLHSRFNHDNDPLIFGKKRLTSIVVSTVCLLTTRNNTTRGFAGATIGLMGLSLLIDQVGLDPISKNGLSRNYTYRNISYLIDSLFYSGVGFVTGACMLISRARS